jgi:hypothetical protein
MELSVDCGVFDGKQTIHDEKATEVISQLILKKLAMAGFGVELKKSETKSYPNLTVYAYGETQSARPRIQFVVALTDKVKLDRQPYQDYQTIIWRRSEEKPFLPTLDAQAEFDRLTDALILDLIAANPRRN